MRRHFTKTKISSSRPATNVAPSERNIRVRDRCRGTYIRTPS